MALAYSILLVILFTISPDLADAMNSNSQVDQDLGTKSPVPKVDPAIDDRILAGWSNYQSSCRADDELFRVQRRVRNLERDILKQKDKGQEQIEKILLACEAAGATDGFLEEFRNHLEQRTASADIYLQTWRKRVDRNRQAPWNRLRSISAELDRLEKSLVDNEAKIERMLSLRDSVSWPSLADSDPNQLVGEDEPVSDLGVLTDSGWVEGVIDIGGGVSAVLLKAGLQVDALRGGDVKVIRKKPLLVLGVSRVSLTKQVGPARLPRGTVASVKGAMVVEYRGEKVELPACYLGSLLPLLTKKGGAVGFPDLSKAPFQFDLMTPEELALRERDDSSL